MNNDNIKTLLNTFKTSFNFIFDYDFIKEQLICYYKKNENKIVGIRIYDNDAVDEIIFNSIYINYNFPSRIEKKLRSLYTLPSNINNEYIKNNVIINNENVINLNLDSKLKPYLNNNIKEIISKFNSEYSYYYKNTSVILQNIDFSKILNIYVNDNIKNKIIYIRIDSELIGAYYTTYNILFLYTGFIDFLNNYYKKDNNDIKEIQIIIFDYINKILKPYIKKVKFNLKDISLGSDVEFELFDKIFNRIVHPLDNEMVFLKNIYYSNKNKNQNQTEIDWNYQSNICEYFLETNIGIDGAREVIELRPNYSNNINTFINNFKQLLLSLRNLNVDLSFLGNRFPIGAHIHISSKKLNNLISFINPKLYYLYDITSSYYNVFDISFLRRLYKYFINLIDNKIGMFIVLSGKARKESSYYVRNAYRFNDDFGTVEYRTLPSIIFSNKKLLKIILKLCKKAFLKVLNIFINDAEVMFGVSDLNLTNLIRLKDLLNKNELLYLIKKRKQLRKQLQLTTNTNKPTTQLLAAWRIRSDEIDPSLTHPFPMFNSSDFFPYLLKKLLTEKLKGKKIIFFGISKKKENLTNKTYNIELDGYETVDQNTAIQEFKILTRLSHLTQKGIYFVGLPYELRSLYYDVDNYEYSENEELQQKTEKLIQAINNSYEKFINNFNKGKGGK